MPEMYFEYSGNRSVVLIRGVTDALQQPVDL